ncbi:MAG TPA: NUDIX hydrolase [Steroidobacteraceae bacterium]|nr:NUDIX hydrolase [Steroidobacteraceae bacterium]
MALKLDVTVAAIVERDGRFLVVQERAARRVVLNQPAGHLEDGESLSQAVVRETLEETGYPFMPQAVTGLYLWRGPSERTFLRVAFSGRVGDREESVRLDRAVIRAIWLDRDQLQNRQAELRSPLVLRCIDDYLCGVRYPLEVLSHLQPAPARAAVS